MSSATGVVAVGTGHRRRPAPWLTSRRHRRAALPVSGHSAAANKMGSVQRVRMGCLGAAKIAPNALLKPARSTGAAVVTAVAARDRTKAEAFARKHGVPRVHDSYEALIGDPDA